jgi:hypothetical protein
MSSMVPPPRALLHGLLALVVLTMYTSPVPPRALSREGISKATESISKATEGISPSRPRCGAWSSAR